MQFNTRKMNNPIKKWSEALNGNKIYRWLKNTGKDVQHHSLLEKCKSDHSEWPSSKSLQRINAGEDVVKRDLPTVLVGM